MARSHGRYSQLYVSITSGGSASPLLHTATTDQNFTTDKQDVTAFGDTNKTYVTGLPDGQMSFAGFASDTVSTGLIEAALDGAARRWYFYPFNSTTIYVYGTGFFDWTVSTDVGGAVKMAGSMAPATAIGRQGF